MYGAGLPHPPMELGQSLDGKDPDGTLTNEEKLGQLHVFPASRYTNQIRGNKTRFTGRPIVAVLLRNTAGFALLPKQLAQLDRTAGYTMTKEANGYSAVLGNNGVCVVDPYLPAAGVADDDIFWGIVRGPVPVLLPLTATGHADIAVNDPLVGHTGTTTGVTTSGRITKVQFLAATSGETGAGLQAFTMAINCIGRALSAKTSQETTAATTNDLLVDLAIRIF